MRAHRGWAKRTPSGWRQARRGKGGSRADPGGSLQPAAFGLAVVASCNQVEELTVLKRV